MELPLWLPVDEYVGLLRADVSSAVAAGLTFRPLDDTIRETLAWSLELGERRRALAGAMSANCSLATQR